MSASEWAWLYAGCALVAAAVMLATLRSRNLWTFRAGLIVFLTGTALWALVDMWRWLAGSDAIQAVEVWTLPASALVVAGVRVSVHAATRPGWRPSGPDLFTYALHPIVTLGVAVTPPLWGYSAELGEGGTVTYGPLFYAHLAVLCALMAAATIDLFRGRQASRVIHRGEAPVLVFIWAVPLVAAVVTLTGQGPNGVDAMPPGLALTSLLIWRILVTADITHSVRIARSQVLEELADAVIVIDDHDQILDANAAALRLVGAEGPVTAFLNRPLRAVWPQIADAAMRKGEHDLALESAGDVVVDVTISPLSEASFAPKGRAVVLRDVTHAVRQRRELALLRTELADLVVRDAMTGLHNRRYAEEVLPENLTRCIAKRVPMSIAVLDVDHFKSINDRYGHPVGDRVLRALAHVMREEIPSSMLARIGGEEFLVMLPGLSSEQARAHVESLRAACARAVVTTREGNVAVTVSAGVATALTPTSTVDALMEAADDALYTAKREGRDRTCVAGSREALVEGGRESPAGP